MAETKSCFTCDHWQGAVGLKLDQVVTLPGGKVFDAIGTGHCEHRIRPRGLTLADYHCFDFTKNGGTGNG